MWERGSASGNPLYAGGPNAGNDPPNRGGEALERDELRSTPIIQRFSETRERNGALCNLSAEALDGSSKRNGSMADAVFF
jgi:hypothetical protein